MSSISCFSEDYLGALVNYNTITNAVASNNERRQKRAVTDSSETALKQLELMENVLVNSAIDYSSAQLLTDQLTSVNIDELSFADRGN